MRGGTCQGLIAGINAAWRFSAAGALANRSEAYIGVLIDDLVTRRIMNISYDDVACEYRLLLRQDNADLRLTKRDMRSV